MELECESNRYLYTAEQQCALENYFRNKNKYPDRNTRMKLQKELGIPIKKLQIWFQNRRARQKKIDRKVLGIAEDPIQRMRLTLRPQLQLPLKFNMQSTYVGMTLQKEDSTTLESPCSASETEEALPSAFVNPDAKHSEETRQRSVLDDLMNEVMVYDEESNETWSSYSSTETETDNIMYNFTNNKFSEVTMATEADDQSNQSLETTPHDQEVPGFSQSVGSLSSISDFAWWDMEVLQNNAALTGNFDRESDVFLTSPTVLDFGTFLFS